HDVIARQDSESYLYYDLGNSYSTNLFSRCRYAGIGRRLR
ncbi:hypothetical protein QF010_006856, partial [Pseudomonas silensiensis]